MRLTPTLSWTLGDNPAEALDERLQPLLEAIAQTGSLAAAVAQHRLSYRAAWGLLRDYERKLGVPLVELERGRGARLAAAGETVLAARRAATLRLARVLPALSVDLRGRAETQVPALRLSIAASHDLALASMRDALPVAAGVALDLAFMGSLHALQQFDLGQVELAGFHVPAGGPRGGNLAFRRHLRARRDRLIRLFEREQGFMLPRGNPQHVRSFRDIARKGLRFVNRQQGSGTRLLIDRHLAAAGVDPAALPGYATEEFTHAAVAATVASGAADAGCGLRAAAAEHGLAFVLLSRERYYFAARVSTLRTPAVERLLAALRGEVFARIVDRLPGYRRAGSGTVLGVEALAQRS
jgi:molybdate transport repressor ModE-like protein